MKVPFSWLTEWVDVPWDARELGARLTMAGFELDALEPAAPPFTGVIVAQIISAERHPQADKLRVCRVATGDGGELVQIVCGASNARAGLKSALAVVGARLPGDVEIKAAKLRGVDSAGMLVSAKELGLAETSAGILELPADAPVGKPLREYLGLDDSVLDLAVTPNRGDAMSVIGIAREVAALTGKVVTESKGPIAGEGGPSVGVGAAPGKSAGALGESAMVLSEAARTPGEPARASGEPARVLGEAARVPGGPARGSADRTPSSATSGAVKTAASDAATAAAAAAGEDAEISFVFTGEFEVVMDAGGAVSGHAAPDIGGPSVPRAIESTAIARGVSNAVADGVSTAATGGAQRDSVNVFLDAPGACPTFVGCVVRGINNSVPSPIWLRERLRRAGVRSISPAVDVTNYVMLELGQPMHAYDLAKLQGDIHVRTARANEPMTLLDGKTIEAQDDVLLITDADGPVGLAGIMGGERTATSVETTDIFLESAFFAPHAIAGRGRRWGLVTDASQRFERGVDPSHQKRATDRAIALLLSIAGGTAGPVKVTQSAENQPARPPVRLRRTRLQRLLGVDFPAAKVSATLAALQMKVTDDPDGWVATPPSHRFDITIEADLIEEVARIIGLESIPEADAIGPHVFRPAPEERASEHVVVEALAMRGYEEAINFAFVDPVLQKRLFPDREGLALANAISSDLSVMRLSLWPGLLKAALENQRRQQDRVRLFEHGAKFVVADGVTREVDSLAGVATGSRLPEQWGIPREIRVPVDFYDVKADIEALLTGTGSSDSFVFEAPANPLPCLHPGRAARILRGGIEVGWLGELHPSLVRELDFTSTPVLFELEMAALALKTPQYREISRFPQVRRDLALVIDETVPLSALAERVTLCASSLLSELRIFDVYRGPGVETGRKSVALGLIFQDISRTLTDEDVERLIASIVTDLRTTLNARIRE
jgi:phenylalanyl-tRNA synthetase beta chain